MSNNLSNTLRGLLVGLCCTAAMRAPAQVNSLTTASPSRLLIIAPQAFTTALQPLVTFKNKTGISCTLISREALAREFSGMDDPERIKRGIAYANQHLSTSYVMLVGDASQIPARYRYVSLMPQDPNVSFVEGGYNPSDLYYANLFHNHTVSTSGSWLLPPVVTHSNVFDTWDLNGNQKYNEQHWNPWDPNDVFTYNPDNVDGCPDVAVGRVPAHTVTDVTHYVNKIIRYESGGMSSSMTKLTFMFDKNYDGSFKESKDIASDSDVEGVFLDANIEYIGLNYANLADLPEPSYDTFGNLGSFGNALTDSLWISYVGHGYSNGWGVTLKAYDGTTYLLNDALVSAMYNKYSLPIVYSDACQTGQFAPEPPYGEYQDRGDTRHLFRWSDPAITGGFNVKDIDTGVGWYGQATVPKPNSYDMTSHSNLTFAYSWLCNPKEVGGIAYMGETVVCQNDKGRDLEIDILAEYAQGKRVLGDLWLGGQQQYWMDNRTSGDVFRAPRIYLGIMTLFGDPSLRLPGYRPFHR